MGGALRVVSLVPDMGDCTQCSCCCFPAHLPLRHFPLDVPFAPPSTLLFLCVRHQRTGPLFPLATTSVPHHNLGSQPRHFSHCSPTPLDCAFSTCSPLTCPLSLAYPLLPFTRNNPALVLTSSSPRLSTHPFPWSLSLFLNIYLAAPGHRCSMHHLQSRFGMQNP